MSAEQPEYKIENISLDKIDPLPIWSRMPSEEYIASLAESIQQNGLINPPSVREVNSAHQCIAGYCRTLALRRLGRETVPCKNYGALDDETAFRIHLSENSDRKDLNPIEEAETFRKLKDHFNCTIEELEEKIPQRYSKSTIQERLMLLELDEDIKAQVASGNLPANVGLHLARCARKFDRSEEQRRIYKKACGHNLRRDEVKALVDIVVSDRYATIPGEIRSKMFDDPLITAAHVTTVLNLPEHVAGDLKNASQALRKEDKIRIIEQASKKKLSVEKMIGYVEDWLETRAWKKAHPKKGVAKDLEIVQELEEAVGTAHQKARQVTQFEKLNGEHAGRIRQCIDLLGKTRGELEKTFAADQETAR